MGAIPNFTVNPPQIPNAMDQASNVMRLKMLMGQQQMLPYQMEQQQAAAQSAQVEAAMKELQLKTMQGVNAYWSNPDKYQPSEEENQGNFKSVAAPAPVSGPITAPAAGTTTSAQGVPPDRLATLLGVQSDDPIMTQIRGMMKAGVPFPGAIAEAQNTLNFRKGVASMNEEQQKVLGTSLSNLKTIAAPILAETDANKKQALIDQARPGLMEWAKFDPSVAQIIPGLNAGNFDAFANRVGAEVEALGVTKAKLENTKTASEAAGAQQKIIPPGAAMSPEQAAEANKQIAVETNPEIQANKIATAKAEGISRANIEAAMMRGSNAALANVPPHLVAPATEAATKAGQDFAQAKSVSDRLAAMMEAAKKGNVVSYQLIPQEGALQVTTSQGVHRINMAEIQNYGGGSLWQRLEGHIGKQLSGKSIPASVLDDMSEMQKIQLEGAQTKYENSLNTINQAYGSSFKPVEMKDLKSAAATPITRMYQGHTYAQQPDGSWKLQ